MPNRPDPSKETRQSAETIHAVPASLAELPWELPAGFLGLDGPGATPEGAATWILPVPYESTTSWGGGTRGGPRAVLHASRYIELYDHELDRDASTDGIYTLPALELTRAGSREAFDELRACYGQVMDAAGGRRLLMIGGEHAVSPAAIRARIDRLDQRLSVLQLDAHLDLRDTFDGSEYSHACAMARIVDDVDLVSVGVRGISGEEMDVVRARDNVTAITAEAVARDDAWMDVALDALSGPVYLTFDVDVLDPSIVPSTGTPEPGGAQWYPTLRFLRKVFTEKDVVAVDVVEHAPIAGFPAPDFLVAKLIYKMIGYWSESGG